MPYRAVGLLPIPGLAQFPRQSPAAGFRIRCDQSPDRFDVSEVEDPSAIFPLDCHLYSSSLPEMASERKLFLWSFGLFHRTPTGGLKLGHASDALRAVAQLRNVTRLLTQDTSLVAFRT